MRNKPGWIAWGVGICLSGLLTTAQAVQISGVTFADTIKIEQTELQIRGADVLTWAMLFDVYAGAFYLPKDHPGRDWTEPVAKRLELSYFREIAGQDFASSSDQLLRENLSPEAYRPLAERLQTLYRLFRDVKPGDRYSLSYIPDKGTELRLNNQPLGIIPGNDFAVAYFGIWIGDRPIKASFRDRLLGVN